MLSQDGYISFEVNGFGINKLVGDHKVVGTIWKRVALVGTIPVVLVVLRLKHLGAIPVEHFSLGCLQTGTIGDHPQIVNAIAIGGKGFHGLDTIGNHIDLDIVKGRASLCRGDLQGINRGGQR